MKDQAAHGCSKELWSGFHTRLCTRNGTVRLGDKWYCGQHDPEAVKARHAARDEKYRIERTNEDAIQAEAKRLARQLGVKAEVYWGSFSGHQRRLVISFEDCEKLAARLDTIRLGR